MLPFKPERECGSCSMCCKIMSIGQLSKEHNKWCWHFKKGGGCAIYDGRPSECQDFYCYWLMDLKFNEEWRPDKAKFLMFFDEKGRLVVDCDINYPFRWKSEPYFSQIRAMAALQEKEGNLVLAMHGDHMFGVTPREIFDLGKTRETHLIGHEFHPATGVIAKIYVRPMVVDF